MNTQKLRVNFTVREFELEGTDAFVASYYEKLNQVMSQTNVAPQTPSPSSTSVSKAPTKPSRSASDAENGGKAGPRTKNSASEVIKVNPNLNLRGGDGVASFKEFATQKKPRSGPEFNATSVFYLEDLMGINPVTLSDAFTCYKEVLRRPPEHFRQAFIDTKNKKSWINVDKNGDLTMTPRGRIFVEHDLPKPPKKEN